MHDEPIGRMHRLQRFQGSNYDVTNRCNLRCEGCLFFAGDDYLDHDDDPDLVAWDRLFADEAARGVNFAYLAGAEPALAPDILRIAYKHIPDGVIFTNGTIKIPQDIGYRLHISIWGGSETAAELRGADSNGKAFRNFAQDPRAVFVMTLNPLNLHEAEEVVLECRDRGARITFSMYTPTANYLEQLGREEGDVIRDDFFRFSSKERNLNFDRDSLAKARAIAGELAARYPETVLFSEAYFDWLCSADPLYDLDEHGIAKNCGNRLSHDWRHYAADRTESDGKCCSPNLDCGECRAYAMSLGSYIKQRPDKLSSGGREKWYAAFSVWCDLFLKPDIQTAVGKSAYSLS
ncbi:MAG: hypothetical protein ABR601_00580 [Parasphingopyxis sp.]|nr:hypothetical protein [Sphingomonadales bacterium]